MLTFIFRFITKLEFKRCDSGDGEIAFGGRNIGGYMRGKETENVYPENYSLHLKQFYNP